MAGIGPDGKVTQTVITTVSIAEHDHFTTENFEQAQQNIQVLLGLSQRRDSEPLQIALTHTEDRSWKDHQSMGFSSSELKTLSECKNYQELHKTLAELTWQKAQDWDRDLSPGERSVRWLPLLAEVSTEALRQLGNVRLDAGAMLAKQDSLPTLRIEVADQRFSNDVVTTDKLVQQDKFDNKVVVTSQDVTPRQSTAGLQPPIIKPLSVRNPP
jgi:hypothetical protein